MKNMNSRNKIDTISHSQSPNDGILNKYAIHAYTHGPVTGSGFLEANTVV